jgi:hypothetical protein
LSLQVVFAQATSNVLKEKRLAVPSIFYKKNGTYYQKSPPAWYSLSLKHKSHTEAWEQFAEGVYRSTGKRPRNIDEMIPGLLPTYIAIGRINGLNKVFSDKGYKSSFSFTQSPDAASFMPLNKTYSERCAFYAYQISGLMSKKYPSVRFTNKSLTLVCLLYDAKRQRFYSDVLEVNERYAPLKGARSRDDLRQMTARVFSALRPPPRIDFK